MSKWLWMGLAFVLVGAGGGVWGYLLASKADAAAIAKAQSQADVCSNNAGAKQAALDEVRQREATRLQELQAVRAVAGAALEARDSAQHKLTALLHKRMGTIRKSAHDDPHCSNLAGLALCPAIAHQLWPAASGTAFRAGGAATGH